MKQAEWGVERERGRENSQGKLRGRKGLVVLRMRVEWNKNEEEKEKGDQV